MENIKIDQKVFILRDSGLFTQVKVKKIEKKFFWVRWIENGIVLEKKVPKTEVYPECPCKRESQFTILKNIVLFGIIPGMLVWIVVTIIQNFIYYLMDYLIHEEIIHYLKNQ